MNGNNLADYGIRPQDLPQAQALMRGRMAMGNTLAMLVGIMTMQGLGTGDLPYDKETRDQWKMRGIQANSFKVGNMDEIVYSCGGAIMVKSSSSLSSSISMK